MKYGKIRIEDGNLIFTRHMMVNHLPCRDILWVYKRQEGVNGGEQKQISTSYLVVVTRRKKRYKFDMTDKEIHDCVQLLSALNPEIVVGFPKGGRIQLRVFPILEIWERLLQKTEDISCPDAFLEAAACIIFLLRIRMCLQRSII